MLIIAEERKLLSSSLCGKVALPGHPRVLLAGLFVPIGESEEKSCQWKASVYACSEEN